MGMVTAADRSPDAALVQPDEANRTKRIAKSGIDDPAILIRCAMRGAAIRVGRRASGNHLRSDRVVPPSPAARLGA